MIPKQSTLSVTDTLPGRETNFSIGNAFWVMESLSDLYSNKELAVIREISTNARDANVEAGNADKPIRVTLPTLMFPYFVVKDEGIGMSPEDLEEIYTKFGVSTKRDSNDFNGMLGFGSKAPIAYTGSFTITAIKDGIKTHAVINKKPDSIVLKVIMTSKTDEPNGVEIKVPVHNHVEFAAKAKDFYRFWFPGTVLVDGVEPEQAVGLELANDVPIGSDLTGWDKGSLYYSANPGTSYVVMGNVGYRIANPAALFNNSKIGNLSFVAFVPNGSVEFVPSREDLKYTDLTKRTLHQIISNFEKKMIEESKREVEQAKSHIEAWHAWNKWGKKLGHSLFSDLEYNGDKLVRELKIAAMRYEIKDPNDTYGRRYSTFPIAEWNIGNMDNTVIVHKFEPDLNTHHKAKMRAFREHVDFDFDFVLFASDKVESPWIDPKRIVTWEQVKAAIPKKKAAGRGSIGPIRIPGTFDYYTLKDGRAVWKTEQELPDGDVMYVTAAQSKDYNIDEVLQLLGIDASIVVLAKNRIAKFTRENPKTKNFIEYANTQLIVDGNSLLSDKAKKAFSLGTRTLSWARNVDLSRVVDPRFKEYRELAGPQGYTQEYDKHQSLATALKRHWDFKRHSIYRNDDSLMEDYPLLSSFNSYSIHEDMYLYINAKYATIKGKKN